MAKSSPISDGGDRHRRRVPQRRTREHVFTRHVDRLAIGDRGVDQFEVEVGEMDYGFEIGGILGMDSADKLAAAGAVLAGEE